MSTRGYICSHSHRFLAYLCAVILQQDPYNEIIDSTYPRISCTKQYISSKVGIIGKEKSDQIRLYECPVIDTYDVNGSRYYLSRTHIKSSLFVYVSNNQGFHIYPDAFVSDIDMGAIKKNYEKSKVLKKKHEDILKQYEPHPPPRSVEGELRNLINQRMILIFSKSTLQKATLFEYLNFQNQKWSKYV